MVLARQVEVTATQVCKFAARLFVTRAAYDDRPLVRPWKAQADAVYEQSTP